jgi:fructokinase
MVGRAGACDIFDNVVINRDYEAHDGLLSTTSKRPGGIVIVVCGEALIDLVPAGGDLWRALSGGGPANTAVALARLETSTAMLARLSDDAFGAQLRKRFVDNNVDLRYAVDAIESTTLAIVGLDEHGGARYTFHLEGTADWQWNELEIPPAFSPEIAAIHAGSMVLVGRPGGPVVERMLERERGQRVISIDPNVRPVMCPDVDEYRSIVERWLAIAHIMKVSADDVSWLYPGREPLDVLAEWAARGPSVVTLTLGPDGAVASTARGETVRVPGIKVDVVDTIGAGDTFTAGLLHSLAQQECLNIEALSRIGAAQLETALSFAAQVSALACMRAGADPPYARDVVPVGE